MTSKSSLISKFKRDIMWMLFRLCCMVQTVKRIKSSLYDILKNKKPMIKTFMRYDENRTIVMQDFCAVGYMNEISILFHMSNSIVHDFIQKEKRRLVMTHISY